MFSPVEWFKVAMNIQEAHIWISWLLFIGGLLFTGWFVHEATGGRMHPGGVIMGVFLSTVLAFMWPFVIGAIPILLGLAVVIGVVYLPKGVITYREIRKTERAARKALAESVDKS